MERKKRRCGRDSEQTAVKTDACCWHAACVGADKRGASYMGSRGRNFSFFVKTARRVFYLDL